MPRNEIGTKTDLFNDKPNQLILGDNLEVLKSLPDESVDLIYIDPPFFSNRNYEVIWGDEGEVRSFKDRWSGGVDHYISWLRERVVEMHRILKKTGSMYLHCDWHADAYIRVYIMDQIFGAGNFRNEIVWKRTGGHSSAKKYAPVCDKIFYYTKSQNFIFNDIKIKYDEIYKSTFRNKDKNGYYKPNSLTGSNLRNGFSGKIWKGYDPNKKNRHWAIPKSLRKEYQIPENKNVLEVLDYLDNINVIIHPENKDSLPSYKQYLHLSCGKSLSDLFDDIPRLSGNEAERIGYPTQKPEALLERIIKASSNEGDVVLDAFMGGGTTIAVADKLKRRWIGIDQSVQAVSVTEARIDNLQWERGKLFDCVPFIKKLHKYDYKTLFHMNAFAFESWIVEQFGGFPNAKQRGDFGIDGRADNGTPIQVKQSEGIGRNVIDNFINAAKRFNKPLFEKRIQDKKPVGTVIAFSFGKGAVQEVARLKNEDGVMVELVEVQNIVPMGTGPKVEMSFKDLGLNSKGEREIEFVADASDTDGGTIECLMWDFNYDMDKKIFAGQVLNDKVGTQKWKFKAGEHNICVKAIDDDGLEGEEIITLKINGGVKKI